MPDSRFNLLVLLCYGFFVTIASVCLHSVLLVPESLTPLKENPDIVKDSRQVVAKVLGLDVARNEGITEKAQNIAYKEVFNTVDHKAYSITSVSPLLLSGDTVFFSELNKPAAFSTNNNTSINTLGWRGIDSIVSEVPENSLHEYLILLSFDGRQTWRSWNGEAWGEVVDPRSKEEGSVKWPAAALPLERLGLLGVEEFNAPNGFRPGTTDLVDIMLIIRPREGEASLPVIRVNYQK